MAKKYTQPYVNWEQLPLLLTVSHLCILLQVTDRTARKLLQNQTIKGKNLGGKWVVPKENLQNYLNS